MNLPNLRVSGDVLVAGNGSTVPRIVYLPRLLSDEQCDSIVALGRKLKPRQAQLLFADGTVGVDTNWRNAKIRSPGNQHFPDINEKLAEITDWKTFGHYHLQSYDPGGYVNMHTDWSGGLSNQRHATLIFYLNDEFEGGETEFPTLDVMVKPKKGAGLFFNYVPGVTQSTHRGRKVFGGEKWILTAWFTERSE